MKSFKYFILLIIITLSLIGGAYSYWGDMVIAEGAVATGVMDVIITEARAPGIERGEVPYVTAGPASISQDGKSANFSVGNIYPSNRIWLQNFRIRAKNTGSIPVKLNSLEFSKLTGSGNSEAVWSSLKGQVHLRLIEPDGSWGPIPGYSSVFDFQHGIEDAIMDLMQDYGELKPDQTAQYVIWFWLDPATVTNDAQNQEIKFNLSYSWVQWNAQ